MPNQRLQNYATLLFTSPNNAINTFNYDYDYHLQYGLDPENSYTYIQLWPGKYHNTDVYAETVRISHKIFSIYPCSTGIKISL